LCFAGWPRVILWKGVGNLVPRGFGANKHVIGGANAGVRVESAHSEVAELSGARETKTGPADSAEGPADAWRSFIHSKKVLPSEPMKILSAHLRIGGERRPMKSSTHRAMAVANVGKWTIHFVTHRTAKATALYGHAAVSSVA